MHAFFSWSEDPRNRSKSRKLTTKTQPPTTSQKSIFFPFFTSSNYHPNEHRSRQKRQKQQSQSHSQFHTLSTSITLSRHFWIRNLARYPFSLYRRRSRRGTGRITEHSRRRGRFIWCSCDGRSTADDYWSSRLSRTGGSMIRRRVR